MAKPFDATSKHLIETRPRDWLRLAGFPVPPSDADVSIVDADLSNVVSVTADKLIRVDNPPDGRGPYLAHIEFQSSADATLDARVLLYNVLSRRRHGLPVMLAMQILMGLKYQEHLTEKLMQSISEMEDSVEWQKIFRRGEARGVAVGEARGRAEGKRNAILHLGTRRFGPPGAAIIQKINALVDDSDLDMLLFQISDVSAWDDLFTI